ncbi:SCO2522 family protein [Phytohabitans rumicis]|uniref:Uncharacterized protein n=1 Tax=Phytohabitans rumicis TaxID=1076125 RepID=A0A6V8L9G3_9ACTN|nr:SCO2522 family protein [Phytohabitans rumicis]GFJ92954.1 hypothetical protein Prum_065960 [Phytohabitans rumicis]
MTSTETAVFLEASADGGVEAVPLSHLSFEVGHLYVEDLRAGVARLRRYFAQVAPWAQAARAACGEEVDPANARISTCFLIDDYFTQPGPPSELVPQIVDAARDSGLRIDYLVRESACAELAPIVEGRLVTEPVPGTNGSRPPPSEVGWLCNGQRSPAPHAAEAMAVPDGWRPPVENAVNRHSIFVDVELWDERGGRRTWSCAFLSAVWQLARLGLIRNAGDNPLIPEDVAELPERWAALPPIVRLQADAPPFFAYQSFSVLGARFLSIESAVRTILSQVAIPGDVLRQTDDRAMAEGFDLPAAALDRIRYAFV